MKGKAEAYDDAKVSACAAQRPEEIGVVVFVSRDQTTVSDHDFGCQKIVDGKPVAGAQPAHAA